jgi:hypothetical protein
LKVAKNKANTAYQAELRQMTVAYMGAWQATGEPEYWMETSAGTFDVTEQVKSGQLKIV